MAGKNPGAPKNGSSKSARLAHIREATLGFHKETKQRSTRYTQELKEITRSAKNKPV